MLGEGEWKPKKHGVGYGGPWRKVRLDIEARALDILATEITDHAMGDASTRRGAELG